MEQDVFSFKRFKVHHSISSMKIGVDAVLLGAWAGYKAKRIIDVGTGCGVIAIMLAQRFLDATIEGVDIDPDSVKEAERNFKESPWKDRIHVVHKSFQQIEKKENYDLIVSNPPYFLSGVVCPETPRERARHQDSLSIFKLLEDSALILTPEGRLSMIFPFVFYDEALRKSKMHKLYLVRECFIQDRPGKKIKRVMAEFSKQELPMERKNLILFDQERIPTEDYRKLCSEFYIRF